MDSSNINENGVRRSNIKLSFASYLIFNILHPLFIMFASVSLITVCWKKGLSNLYTWHVLLTGLGFHLLMAAGISVLYGGNSLIQPATRSMRKTTHWIMQTVGAAFVLIGTALQYISREMKHKQHIVSTHSIVGLIALLFIVVSLANGLTALFGHELRRWVRPSSLNRMHHATGTASFTMGMYAILLAYDKQIFADFYSYEVRIGFMVVTVATGVFSLFGVFRNMFYFFYEKLAGSNENEYILNDME